MLKISAFVFCINVSVILLPSNASGTMLVIFPLNVIDALLTRANPDEFIELIDSGKIN